jgi:ElaB/YqjD/DUF883 family membrane-anchored ribosome-binding protein
MRRTSQKSTAENNTSSHLVDAGNRVKEFINDNSTAIRERVAETYDAARHQAEAGLKSSRRIVRRHPLESVLVSLGVGVFVGMLSGLLFGRRK